MALAKAFPDTYMYELHEPSSVSPPHTTLPLFNPSAPPDTTVTSRFPSLRSRASVTRGRPPCRRLRRSPATRHLAKARTRTTTRTSATTRIWRRRRTGWTSASPTPCRTKTSRWPSSPPALTARVTKTDVLVQHALLAAEQSFRGGEVTPTSSMQ